MTKAEKDFEELLSLFNKHKVEYCIVGAFAVAFHSVPRYTKDMDILIKPHADNGERIIAALKEFGFGKLGLTAKDFSKAGQTIQLGYEPVRIDLLTMIDGCSFDAVWRGKRRGTYGAEQVYFIGLEELIKNKKAVARTQDLADIERLVQVKKK